MAAGGACPNPPFHTRLATRCALFFCLAALLPPSPNPKSFSSPDQRSSENTPTPAPSPSSHWRWNDPVCPPSQVRDRCIKISIRTAQSRPPPLLCAATAGRATPSAQPNICDASKASSCCRHRAPSQAQRASGAQGSGPPPGRCRRPRTAALRAWPGTRRPSTRWARSRSSSPAHVTDAGGEPWLSELRQRLQPCSVAGNQKEHRTHVESVRQDVRRRLVLPRVPTIAC